MNVYFISPEHIRPFDFKFLMSVLKIKKVFSFIPSLSLDKEIIATLDSLETKYCPAPSKQIDFYKSCVFSICSKIVKTNRINNSLQYEDTNIYEDSVNFSPKNNLLKTNDDNILILAFCKTGMSSTGVIWTPQFHFDSIHQDSIKRDISREISNFSCNLLKKRLRHSKYNNRICFFKLDEYLMRGFYYNATNNKWIEYWSLNKNGKRKPFMSYISSLLYRNYPEIFTVSKNADKIIYDKPYPTSEALKLYKEFLKEAENRQEDDEREENDNYYPIDGFLEAYGDALSDEEYENYIQE